MFLKVSLLKLGPWVECDGEEKSLTPSALSPKGGKGGVVLMNGNTS